MATKKTPTKKTPAKKVSAKPHFDYWPLLCGSLMLYLGAGIAMAELASLQTDDGLSMGVKLLAVLMLALCAVMAVLGGLVIAKWINASRTAGSFTKAAIAAILLFAAFNFELGFWVFALTVFSMICYGFYQDKFAPLRRG